MSQLASKAPSQKNPSVRMPKLRAASRGAECMMQVPGVCNHDTATTVLAHSNEGDAGRGTGYKGHDWLGVNMCSDCHDFYDGRSLSVASNIDAQEIRSLYFDEAWPLQVRWWLEKGLLK